MAELWQNMVEHLAEYSRIPGRIWQNTWQNMAEHGRIRQIIFPVPL